MLSRHNNDESLNPNSLVAAWALHAKAFYRYLRIVLDPNGNSEGAMQHAYASHAGAQPCILDSLRKPSSHLADNVSSSRIPLVLTCFVFCPHCVVR